MVVYLIALISIVLGSFAQLLLKTGVGSAAGNDLLGGGLMQTAGRLISNPAFLGGVVCYALSFLLWLYVLSKMELSRAYPLVGLGYIFALFLGWCFLDESITGLRILGVLLIVSGVFFIAKS